jgi:hypothetical protein
MKIADRKMAVRCRRFIGILVVTCSLFIAGPLFVSQAQGQPDESSSLKMFGDVRLRYENTNNQKPGSDLLQARSREVVRFRMGLTKNINDFVTFGARLATGSSDDPNTSDVTLGNFVDDLEISLDRVYLELDYRDALLTGGKFANPFRRTDLVWDGDVNPQGVSGSYKYTGSDRIVPKLTGLFSIVDEHALANIPDSDMFGGQLELSIELASELSLTLAGGYYDYDINSISNADAGDIRSNTLNSDTTGYLSDFNLFDAIVIIEHSGFGERYPLRFIGDYVKNLGAEIAGDQGFSLDLFIGRASKKNDARFRYGYSEADTDAVLAAFSHDNTTIATNYQQHSVTVDYVALENTTLNVTWYLHRKAELESGSGTDCNEYISRLRLNTVVKF